MKYLNITCFLRGITICQPLAHTYINVHTRRKVKGETILLSLPLIWYSRLQNTSALTAFIVLVWRLHRFEVQKELIMDWESKLNNLCFMINSIKDKQVANENLRALYTRKGKMKPINWQLRLINMKERCLWAKWFIYYLINV